MYCYSSSSAQTAFPIPLSDSSAATLAWDWLNSDESKNFDFPKTGWFADNDHDGSNSLGWRVYCEDWGNVNGDYGVICAIHPAFLWYGK
ncbi:hypothetical protein Xoosp13_203 [Xanthomonas phage Xoo-sp13]|nr:hypothetical protein Xoosp13_203 [Xanthomonas phage Xoo-sp13]